MAFGVERFLPKILQEFRIRLFPSARKQRVGTANRGKHDACGFERFTKYDSDAALRRFRQKPHFDFRGKTADDDGADVVERK